MGLIAPARHHRSIDGLEIRRLRGSLSQEWLASRACEILGRDTLSRQYITQLEGPGEDKDHCHDIPSETALAIEQALTTLV